MSRLIHVDPYSLPDTFSDDRQISQTLQAMFREAERKRKRRIKKFLIGTGVGVVWALLIASGDWRRFLVGLTVWEMLLWVLR